LAGKRRGEGKRKKKKTRGWGKPKSGKKSEGLSKGFMTLKGEERKNIRG